MSLSLISTLSLAMTDEESTNWILFQLGWVIAFFVVFVRFYNRYSVLYHQIEKVRIRNRVNLVSDEFANAFQAEKEAKASALIAPYMYAVVGVGVIHALIQWFIWGSEMMKEYYVFPLWFTIGTLGIIFLATKTKGGKVLPTGRFRNTDRF